MFDTLIVPESAASEVSSRNSSGRLYSVLLRLHPTGPGRVQPGSGSQAHAAFLDILHQHDPVLSESLHRSNQRRPFTVGPLRGFANFSPAELEAATLQGRPVVVRPGQTYWLRFTMLDERVFGTFARHFLLNFRASVIRLGEAEFEMSRLLTTPDLTEPATTWADYSSFSTLFEQAQAQERYHFEFSSPTAFSLGQKSWGKEMKLFPDPDWFFLSLARQWQNFAPEECRMERDGLNPETLQGWCAANVVVSRYTLSTLPVQFKRASQLGFQGQVVYEVKGNKSEREWRWLSRLGRFALFCGVGYKTTMGMGQTRLKG